MSNSRATFTNHVRLKQWSSMSAVHQQRVRETLQIHFLSLPASTFSDGFVHQNTEDKRSEGPAEIWSEMTFSDKTRRWRWQKVKKLYLESDIVHWGLRFQSVVSTSEKMLKYISGDFHIFTVSPSYHLSVPLIRKTNNPVRLASCVVNTYFPQDESHAAFGSDLNWSSLLSEEFVMWEKTRWKKTLFQFTLNSSHTWEDKGMFMDELQPKNLAVVEQRPWMRPLCSGTPPRASEATKQPPKTRSCFICSPFWLSSDRRPCEKFTL